MEKTLDQFNKIDILLVDDRNENLLTLEAVLACPEYNLVKLSSGADVLRHLLQNTPAVILMDVKMPDLDGFETASIIKSNERTREIPIIFVTGVIKDEKFVHRGYDHGAVDYIYKPYDSHILRSKVAVFAEIWRQRRMVSRMVAVQQAATEALAEATGVEEAVSKILKVLCSCLGWDFGAFWRVDRQSRTLFRHSEWKTPGRDVPAFLNDSLGQRVGPGETLPGRVWSSHKAAWIEEMATDSAFREFRSAVQAGLTTAAAVPLRVQDEILGVLELYSSVKQTANADLIKIMEAIGSQIGQVLKRTETFEQLQASQSLLQFLADTSTTLSETLDYDETIASVAKLGVGTLADWCVIDLLAAGERPRGVVIAAADGQPPVPDERFVGRPPIEWAVPVEAGDVIESGQSIVCADYDGPPAGVSSMMLAPLVARGKVVGVMAFFGARRRRRYTKDDILAAEEFARRAAMAIENATLYRDAQDALRSRDEFFSIASHELKTPITSLKMLLQITQRGVNPSEGKAPSPEALAKMLTTSCKQVDQLSHLIEDLLDVVKIRAGKLTFKIEEVDLAELVGELVQRYAGTLSAAQCELSMDLKPGVIGLWDRTRIEQVIVNLLSNVAKYAPGAPLAIEVSARDDMARLVVRDSGPGIEADQQTKIFQRFERSTAPSKTSVTGLGLGLFITKQIIETHRGTVHVESSPGKGSAFIIELPTKHVDSPRENRGVTWNSRGTPAATAPLS